MNYKIDPATYTITADHSTAYNDGFADGYSRAWQECWEYMRHIANNTPETTEEAP